MNEIRRPEETRRNVSDLGRQVLVVADILLEDDRYSRMSREQVVVMLGLLVKLGGEIVASTHFVSAYRVESDPADKRFAQDVADRNKDQSPDGRHGLADLA